MTPNNKTASLLAPFSIALFRLTLVAEEPLILPPFKGSALRGVFGHTFRRIVCPLRTETCQNCPMSDNCLYAYTFETILSESDPFLRKMTNAPHPFVIRPPQDHQENYSEGDELVFDLVLIGRVIEQLPYFALTFSEMGKRGIGRGRGKFHLKQIEAIKLGKEACRVYSSSDRILENIPSVFTLADISSDDEIPDRCTFRFLTPLRIKEKGNYLEKVHFSVLFRNLLRRIVVLAKLHCDIDCSGMDFEALSHAADSIKTVSSDQKWHFLRRYSNRQKDHTPLHGILGEVSFEGDFTPFWQFIRLGEYVHGGKNTSFGLGRYECEMQNAKCKVQSAKSERR